MTKSAKLMLGAAALAGVLMACGGGSDASTPEPDDTAGGYLTGGDTSTPVITGTLLLAGGADAYLVTGSGGCMGDGGYDDISAGAQVKVTDADGSIVATSNLTGGRVTTIGGTGCEFDFVTEIPADLEFCTVEVSHRGGLTYSAAELEALGWELALTLG